MVTAISIGFLNGIRGKTGFFFRPPKSGLERVGDNKYFRDVQLDRIVIAEAIFVTLALVLSILIAFQSVWFLALSLAGFGALTLEPFPYS